MTAEQEIAPPPRFLLRPAGVLTQLIGAFALLLGTITFILVQQNKTGGAALVIAWSAAAMAGVVFGGLMARGGMVSVIAGALINATFGIVLFAIDWDALRSLLRLLPESDVAMIADLLVGVAIGMVATSVLCFASIPQARAYNRALREAEAEAEKSGFFAAQSGPLPQPVQVPVSMPPPRSTAPVAVPPPPSLTPAPGMAFRGGAGSSDAHRTMTPTPAPMQARISDRQLPLPAPPPTGDGYTPPPPSAPPEMPPPIEEYIPASASTAPGWAPAPARTHTTMMLVRPPAAEKRSRRRVYMMLGGFAIGLGAGVGVLVSSIQDEKREEIAASSSSAASSAEKGSGSAKSPDPGPIASAPIAPIDAAVAAIDAVAAAPAPPIKDFLDTQRDLIGQADLAKLATTLAPTAFAIGIDADDVAEGRDAIEAMLTKNLGDPPPDGFKVTSRFLAVGEEPGYAWTAEEIELSGPNLAPRRITITQLAAVQGGAWSVVALCWAQPVRDDTAERLAILGTLPTPRAVPDRADGEELAKAAKSAFASRSAFAAARSERADGFNFGSGPNERIVGGAKIKALFGRLRSELHIDGGARTVALGPTIGFAALNATYTQKSRAATDVTQTFRVLAVLLKEGTAWKIVQTQFSNGGPISD